MRRFLTKCVYGMLIMLFASVSVASAEKVLTIGISKEPTTLNPILMEGIFAESLAGNMYDTLVGFKDSAEAAEPLLAEKWKISADGKVYTFYLRKGVKFHNGQELTAADVKYTYEVTLDEKTASPNREFIKPIQKIETPDDYTVILTLDKPYAPFLLALANPSMGIVPAKYMKEVGMDGFAKAPIGSGAFAFVEMIPDDRIVLKKNADYFIANPKLDKVVFRPIPKLEVMAAELQAGGIDLATELLPQDIKRLDDEGFAVQSVPGLVFRYIGFSDKTMPFADVRFRKAVYHAVPFAQAIPGIYRESGSRAYNWIPETALGNDLEYMKSRALQFDMGKAKALMDELRAEGVLPEDFEFDIYTSGDERKKVSTVISTQLRALGIKVNVQSPEWGSMFPLLKAGKCDMYAMGWGSVPDPHRWTYRIFMPDSSMNFSKYNNPMVTEALEAGATESDPAKRAALYTKAMRKALGEDYVHIPLVWMKTITAANTRVKGFTPSPQKYVHLVTWKRNVDVQ